LLTHLSSVVDTLHLGRELPGSHSLSLSDLMSAVEIPCEADTFHCAGNDAFYTMQLFLALLVRSVERVQAEGVGGAEGSACAQLRDLAWRKAPMKKEVRRMMDEKRKEEGKSLADSGDCSRTTGRRGRPVVTNRDYCQYTCEHHLALETCRC
jgi:DNA polymerase III epsilon subunit-like protein